MTARQTMTLNLSAAEMAVVEQLAVDADISKTAVVRQALRHYQILVTRLKAGERVVFSGDRERAALFVGLGIPDADTSDRSDRTRDDPSPDTLASSYVDLEGVGLGPLTQPPVIDMASSATQSDASCAPVTKAAASLDRAIPTTCVETLGGDPNTAIRLSFQIKVF